MDVYRLTPATEIEERITRLQSRLAGEGLDAALLVQATDLFYFAGTAQQAHLYVPQRGQALLAVRKSVTRAQEESPMQAIPLESLRHLPDLLRSNGFPDPARLGMELDVLPAAQFFRYQKLFPGVELRDLSAGIRLIRTVKSDYELAIMRRAAAVAELMFQAAREHLRPGMTELELAALVEAAGRHAGHQGTVPVRAFNQGMHFGHLLSGPGAALPSSADSPTGGRGLNPRIPFGAGQRTISRNEPVLLDLLAAVDGYLVDQSRVLAVGSLDPRLVHALGVARDIQDRVASLAVPGADTGELYRRAVSLAADAGLGDHFMGWGESRVAFVGHGIGIELDEPPVFARGADIKLEEGMTFALEPKFTFPDLGVVGIENTYVVRPGGAERLTFSADDACLLP